MLRGVSPDPIPQAWHHVAEAVRRRREELGLTQREAAQAGGISEPTWGLIENAGRHSYKKLTIAGITRALQWSPDSIDRILIGDEPIPSRGPARAITLDERVESLTERLDRVEEVLRQLVHQRLAP